MDDEFEIIQTRTVRASKLGEYIGHKTAVDVHGETRRGRIIHTNLGLYYIYVYVITAQGTTSCGRFPRWHKVRITAGPVNKTFREDLKTREPRRSDTNFDVETGRPLGPTGS